MSGRTVRRFVDGLLRGQRTERARPDDFEAQEMKTAIELRAARTGSDSPREEFATDLHRRLAVAMGEAPQADARSTRGPSGTRRQVVIGTGLAAASAATGIVVGRNLLGGNQTAPRRPRRQPRVCSNPTRVPGTRSGRASTSPKGEHWPSTSARSRGSSTGPMPKVEAVSGICTHQGCKLWLDAPESRLRCPCHSTSFSLEGKTLTHQLPTAPAPLPKFEVREINGVIEVFAPTEPA